MGNSKNKIYQKKIEEKVCKQRCKQTQRCAVACSAAHVAAAAAAAKANNLKVTQGRLEEHCPFRAVCPAQPANTRPGQARYAQTYILRLSPTL